MKKKLTIATSAALAVFGTLIALTVGVFDRHSLDHGPSADDSRTLSMKGECDSVDESGHPRYNTADGTPIAVDTTSTAAPAEGHLIDLKKDDTIENLTPIAHIQKVEISYEVAGVPMTDDTDTSNLTMEAGYVRGDDSELTGVIWDNAVAFSNNWIFSELGKQPSHLRFTSKKDDLGIIEITIKYACVPGSADNHDSAENLVADGLYVVGEGSFLTRSSAYWHVAGGRPMTWNETAGQNELLDIHFKKGDMFRIKDKAGWWSVNAQSAFGEIFNDGVEGDPHTAILTVDGDNISVQAGVTLSLYLKEEASVKNLYIAGGNATVDRWVVGKFDGVDAWSIDKGKAMTRIVSDEGVVSYELTTDLTEGDEFKVLSENNDWQGNLAATSTASVSGGKEGANIKIGETGNYKITFTPSGAYEILVEKQ